MYTLSQESDLKHTACMRDQIFDTMGLKLEMENLNFEAYLSPEDYPLTRFQDGKFDRPCKNTCL